MTETTKQHYDEDAEQAVIGAILIDNRTLASVPNLEVDDFATGDHKILFTAIRNLEAQGLPIDLVTLGGEIDRWAKVRGLNSMRLDATIGACALRCPAPENVPHYAEILRRHRTTRETKRALASLLGQAERGELEGDELVAEASGEILRLTMGSGNEDPGANTARIIRDECDRIAFEEGQEGTSAGMPTGLRGLDVLTGGIPFAVTTLVLARPGHGKTTLVHNMAWCASVLGNDTPLLYSYEDNHQSFAQRSIAQSSGVPTERIRTREFQQGDMTKMAQARARMLSRREIIVRAAGMGVDELIRDARSRRLRGSTDGSTVGRLVIVDYVQKMPEPSGSTRNERLGVLSRKLSEFASKDGIAVVVCSQVNRSVEKRDDHIPSLSDARDCGELEQDCKLALGLYRPCKYEAPPTGEKGRAPETLLELHVLKNHNGRDNIHASVFWDLQTHTICDSADDLRDRRQMGGGN